MLRFIVRRLLSSLAVSLLTAEEPARVVPKHYKVAAADAATHSDTPDGRFRLYAEEVAGGGDHLYLQDLTTGERAGAALAFAEMIARVDRRRSPNDFNGFDESRLLSARKHLGARAPRQGPVQS